MSRAQSIQHSACRIVACTLSFVLLSTHAGAVPSIDISLNLTYASPQSPLSGGQFEVVVKSNQGVDGFGLAGLRVLLTNVNIASIQSTAPRGIVNGNVPAGMWVFSKKEDTAFGFIDVALGQAPRVPDTISPQEQSVFYGIGTLTNGAPNYPGKPPTSNFIGPAFTTLTNVLNVPWTTTNTFNKPEWVTAAKLLTGSFAAGSIPGFYSNGLDFSRGNVYTSVGTSTHPGNITEPAITATTIVRTNLVQSADYNHNGFVDAADYIVWRNTFGSMTLLDADGNSNGTIDDGDYTIWKMNFGTMVGPGAGTSSGATLIPEPGCALLLAIGTTLAFSRSRRSSRPKIRRRRGPQGARHAESSPK